MSIEYTSSVVPDSAACAFLREALAQEPTYIVIPGNREDVISLRFADRPARTKWPADIEIHLGDGLKVTFHSATRDEREALMSLLVGWMIDLGHSFSFDRE
jgi:hypothetical protein